ncbi:AAA family ATPase [Piscinibacterium candidicorallinum]|uniref:AAA family ATPase n=1 Tax=Piscinibacterium candidicorallinum TaxID=1793872 RepID=A0ABV7H4D6_9BURK
MIALVGLAGSGKSEAGKVLQALGYTVVYFGGAVLEEVRRRGLEVTAENEREVREDLRRQHGMAAMAILKLPEIERVQAQGAKVAVDGLYSFAEYELLRERLGHRLKLIAIHTPRALRYQRLAARAVRPLSPEQIDQRDYFEIKNLDKGGPIAIADVHLVNAADAETLHRRVEEAVATLENSI